MTQTARAQEIQDWCAYLRRRAGECRRMANRYERLKMSDVDFYRYRTAAVNYERRAAGIEAEYLT